MHSLIKKAQEFAHAGHDSISQKRKYTNQPYWAHTDAVAQMVHNLPVGYFPLHIQAEITAHLHDLVEDVNIYPYNLIGIKEEFGDIVAKRVEQLTHKYTSLAYPNLNRAERKILEAHRLSNSHPWVQTIKVFDLIDNTTSIVKNDPEFAKVYLEEKDYLLNVLTLADRNVVARAKKQLTAARKSLNL